MGKYLLLAVLAAFVHFGQSDHLPSSVATHPRSCPDVYNQGDTTSGFKSLENSSGFVYEVYCYFVDNQHGYMFLSKAAVNEIDSLEFLPAHINEFLILQRLENGETKEALIEPLPMFETFGFTTYHNMWGDFTLPLAIMHYGDKFLYLGNLEKNTYSKYKNNHELGFILNGQNFTYNHCEDWPNSYFAFYTNENNAVLCQDTDEWPLNKFFLDSFQICRTPDVMDSPDYWFAFDVTFGGCGILYASSDGCFGLRGFAIGLPFEIPSISNHDDCGCQPVPSYCRAISRTPCVYGNMKQHCGIGTLTEYRRCHYHHIVYYRHVERNCCNESCTGIGNVPDCTCDDVFPACDTSHSLETEPIWPRDCEDLKHAGYTVSGQYNITLVTGRQVLVHCDMVTEGGGWTMLLSRFGGHVDFRRGWSDYKHGFGNDDDFWIGNDIIHELTTLNQRHYKLHIKLMNLHDGSSRFATYDNFSVADEASKYKLSVDGYSGNAGDGLAYHNGMEFSTRDEDNDLFSTNCALKFTGGWWYNSCHTAHLTGLNKQDFEPGYAEGIGWRPWLGHDSFMDYADMKIRPI